MGQAFLAGFTEGGEEFIEALIQTALQKMTYDPDAQFSLENALRQALTGAAFGATVSSLDSLVSSAKKDGFLAGFYEKEIKNADNRDSGNNILIEEDENSLLKGKAATQENSRTKIDSGTKYDYNDDGTVIVTDDWTTISHPNITQFYKENAVIDILSQSGHQRDRIFSVYSQVLFHVVIYHAVS